MKRILSLAAFALLTITGLAAAQGPAWTDALDEVNATRAQRGLYPFARDDGLTAAAGSAATYRAAHGIAGHTANDFAALPAGCSADAAGCAAWAVGSGWGACCTYDSGPTHAGAAWAIGANGLRFMHLFVRRGGGPVTVNVALPTAGPAVSCPDGKCPAAAPKTTSPANCSSCGSPGGQAVVTWERRPVVAVVGRVLHPFARLRGRCR